MPDFLALDWEPQQLYGVEAQVSGETVRIRNCFVLRRPEADDPADNPEQMGGWLKKELHRAGVRIRQVLVSLPREEAIVRRLELPDAPDDELPDLVRLQAATQSSLPLDQLLLDFLPLPKRADTGGRDVLLTTITRERVERLRQVCEAADLELLSIGISSVAAAELVARVERRRGDDADQASLIITRLGNRVEVSVIRQHRLLFSHSAGLAGENNEQRNQSVLAEISRSVVALERTIPGIVIARAWVAGSADETPQLLETMQQRLQCDVMQPLDPLSDTNVTIDTSNTPGSRGLYAGSVGTLLARAEPVVEAIDFLNPRKPPVKRDQRKLQIAVGAGAALFLLVIGLMVFYVKISGLNSKIERLEAQNKELDLEFKAGQPVLEAATEIREWSDRDIHWLDQFDELNRVMDGTERIYFTDFRVTPSLRRALGAVHATGFARREIDVRILRQQLADRKYRVTPTSIVRSDADPEYPYRFELEIELVESREPQQNQNQAGA
jgi:hypothetical protein